jgi:hypothetical protein
LADATALPAIRASVRMDSGSRTQPRPSTTSEERTVHGLLADAPVVDRQHPRGDPLRSFVVCHHQQRCTGVLGVLAQEVVDLIGRGRIEFAGRFVGDDQAGTVGQCRGERDALAFSSGQRRRAAVGRDGRGRGARVRTGGAPTAAWSRPARPRTATRRFEAVEVVDEVETRPLADDAEVSRSQPTAAAWSIWAMS